MQQEMAVKVVKASSFLQGKCTSVFVETEKNAHSQSNAVSFAVTIFLSGLNWERAMLVQEPQSVSQSVRRRLTNLRYPDYDITAL